MIPKFRRLLLVEQPTTRPGWSIIDPDVTGDFEPLTSAAIFVRLAQLPATITSLGEYPIAILRGRRAYTRFLAEALAAGIEVLEKSRA